MNDKKLRKRMNRIRDAMTIITNELNAIYSDNEEENLSTLPDGNSDKSEETNRNFTASKKKPKSYATNKCACGNTKTAEASTCYECYRLGTGRKTS